MRHQKNYFVFKYKIILINRLYIFEKQDKTDLYPSLLVEKSSFRLNFSMLFCKMKKTREFYKLKALYLQKLSRTLHSFLKNVFRI